MAQWARDGWACCRVVAVDCERRCSWVTLLLPLLAVFTFGGKTWGENRGRLRGKRWRQEYTVQSDISRRENIVYVSVGSCWWGLMEYCFAFIPKRATNREDIVIIAVRWNSTTDVMDEISSWQLERWFLPHRFKSLFNTLFLFYYMKVQLCEPRLSRTDSSVCQWKNSLSPAHGCGYKHRLSVTALERKIT